MTVWFLWSPVLKLNQRALPGSPPNLNNISLVLGSPSFFLWLIARDLSLNYRTQNARTSACRRFLLVDHSDGILSPAGNSSQFFVTIHSD